MHGEHMEAQLPMGFEVDSGDGGMRSYDVPRKVQGEAAGSNMSRDHEAPMDAWGSWSAVRL